MRLRRRLSSPWPQCPRKQRQEEPRLKMEMPTGQQRRQVSTSHSLCTPLSLTMHPPVTQYVFTCHSAAKEERQRKRKSRWGNGQPAEAAASSSGSSSEAQQGGGPGAGTEAKEGDDPAAGGKKARRSRFSAKEDSSVPAPVQLSQEVIQQSLVLQMQLKTINERLPGLANEAAAIELDPNRSPSPPPRYDGNGKRTNTREMRMREQLTKERGNLIERLLKINPNYQPPADYVRQKPMRKMYIPIKEYPNYNFIGTAHTYIHAYIYIHIYIHIYIQVHPIMFIHASTYTRISFHV